MAKKANITPHTLETYAIVSKVERRLTDLYGRTYQGVLQLSQVRRAIQAGQPFTFEPNRPETKALIKSLDVLAQRTDRLLQDSVTNAWQKGEDSVTNACYSAFGRTAAGRDAVRAIADRAREDLRGRGVSAGAYYTEKHGGLNISDRVWGNSLFAKQEIEEIIQQGILQGKSADQISQSVRGYLRNPNKLFRRVRNKETGALELSKNAKNYHPGRGVYRSSYQNALRLARTEVNAAYRRAEWESYQNNPLITGFKIMLSNNHTTLIKGKKVALTDICDELAGEYPKTFQWTGWHPQCRCKMVPIFIKEGDFRSRIRALAAGKLDTWKASNTVTEPPKAFTDWVADNADRLKAGKQMPYFIVDNYVGGDPTRGLVKDISSLKKQVQESKKIEPVTEWDHEIASFDRWAAAFELDTTQAKILRDAGDRKGLRAELDRLDALRDKRHEAWLLESAKLFQIIEKMRAGKYTALAQKYADKRDKHTCREGGSWRADILQLKALQVQALADLADAEEKTKELAAQASKDQDKTIAKELGAEKGKAMDHDAANEHRGNPNYRAKYIWDETTKKWALNPEYKKEWGVNCQSCVVAYELRRRGWDVSAQPNTEKADCIPEKLSHMTNNAWRDKKGTVPAKQKADAWTETGNRRSLSAMLNNLEKLTKEPGRYHIDWGWKRGNSGHIITCERLKDGKMRFYDPQTGELIPNFKEYAKAIALKWGINVLRVDNLAVNTEWVAGIVRKN